MHRAPGYGRPSCLLAGPYAARQLQVKDACWTLAGVTLAWTPGQVEFRAPRGPPPYFPCCFVQPEVGGSGRIQAFIGGVCALLAPDLPLTDRGRTRSTGLRGRAAGPARPCG